MAEIEIRDLVRDFGAGRATPRRAVDHLSLDVRRGELFGLLGPNGAGKTTTVKILMTVLLPTSGSVRVCGRDVVAQRREVSRRVGVVLGGERGLYDRLSARDNLRFFADLYGLSGADRRRRVPELLELVGLTERAGDRVEQFSRGMKQRLHIARGLLHDPPVVIMDEPSNGLDPVAARDLRDLVRTLTASGRAVLLTTHYMQEAEALCDRIAVVDHGRKIFEGTPRELTYAADGRRITVIELYGAGEPQVADLRELKGVESVTLHERGGGQVLQIQSMADHDVTQAAVERLAGLPISRVTVQTPTLEDAYIALISAQAADAV
ncbi:MAG TPA: ABC transporter ATP-binding protein [Actinospica sp.]|jgi:ABC-2 type transport system ATP-binding protein|nr:ABC transporter ATP-binding protein [Actinospica sp.]